MEKKDRDANNVVNFSQRKQVLLGLRKKSAKDGQGKKAISGWYVFLQLIVVLALIAFMLKQC